MKRKPKRIAKPYRLKASESGKLASEAMDKLMSQVAFVAREPKDGAIPHARPLAATPEYALAPGEVVTGRCTKCGTVCSTFTPSQDAEVATRRAVSRLAAANALISKLQEKLQARGIELDETRVRVSTLESRLAPVEEHEEENLAEVPEGRQMRIQ